MLVRAYRSGEVLNKLHARPRAGMGGWSITCLSRLACLLAQIGPTHSTGFPVTFYNYQDTSLLGTQGNGINNLAVDGLQYTRGPLHFNRNPRNGSPYFNTELFALPPLGSVGN